MNIVRGKTAETAFKVEIGLYESHKIDNYAIGILNELFGTTDGSYMILTQQEVRSIDNKTYRAYMIEDKDKDKHTLYFEVIKKEVKSKLGY